MAYYTSTQADTYFDTKATIPGGWDSLEDSRKALFLEMASNRFDALPWLPAFETEAARVTSTPIEAAFYEYLRYVAEREGRTSTRVPEDPTWQEDDVNALADMPASVAARLIPFLDAERLGNNALSTVSVGDTTITFNPARETAAEAAANFGRAQ